MNALLEDIGWRPAADMALPGPSGGHRVVVAMSGGVDSSATAALLVAAGYDVVGITLQLYDHGAASPPVRTGGKSCCAGQDIYDARQVAEALGIPHYVLDYEARFRTEVMEPFADAYRAGETPVPCVLCNRTVKFRDLLDTARDLGAAALATGHYVRRRPGDDGPILLKGADVVRDQSYFLFATTRAQLGLLRFPLGELGKDVTRQVASRFSLPVADKADSQDICFVPTGGYARVVERLRPGALEPGEIVDLDGRVVGRHDGIAHFTVGQRRGLGVAAGYPLFVVRLDPNRRQVVVGPESALLTERFNLRDVNWLGAEELPAAGLRLDIKVRSTRPATPATVYGRHDGGAEVVLDTPQAAVAPGQAGVLYRGDRLLGGGWIARDVLS